MDFHPKFSGVFGLFPISINFGQKVPKFQNFCAGEIIFTKIESPAISAFRKNDTLRWRHKFKIHPPQVIHFIATSHAWFLLLVAFVCRCTIHSISSSRRCCILLHSSYNIKDFRWIWYISDVPHPSKTPYIKETEGVYIVLSSFQSNGLYYLLYHLNYH